MAPRIQTLSLEEEAAALSPASEVSKEQQGRGSPLGFLSPQLRFTEKAEEKRDESDVNEGCLEMVHFMGLVRVRTERPKLTREFEWTTI